MKSLDLDEVLVIAIDLDGTLATLTKWKGHKHIGEPIKENIEYIKELYEMGHKLILYTTRLNPNARYCEDVGGASNILYISNWLLKHGIYNCFDDITGRKPYADIYFDDRAVSTLEQLKLWISKQQNKKTKGTQK